MTRIGFSLAGEGRGHASRVIALSQVLRNRYDIVYFCPDTIRDFIESNLPQSRIITVPELSFVKKGHGINYPGTIAEVLGKVRTLKADLRQISLRLQESGVTVLISDFEPYTSRAAALLGVPVLNLNHPGIVLKFLSLSPGAWIAQLTASLMMPPAHETLICSFYFGDVGPIIRKELREAVPVREDFYLVYAKDSSREKFQRVLESFPETEFRIFPDASMDFTQALIHCRAVIAPAGHQLMSEALVLGKPVLAVPQAGQYEQKLNARMLRRSKRGNKSSMWNLKHSIACFLRDIDEYASVADCSRIFRFNDETLKAVEKVEVFIRDADKKRLDRRIQYNWFNSIPGTIAQIGFARHDVA